MEKYFKIEMRLAEGATEIKPGIYQLVDKFYYGDGYIRIENNKISGMIALDYIKGKINEEIVEMCLYAEDEEIEFAIAKDDFYLPQKFLLLYENVIIQFYVEEEIKNQQKQKRIRDGIEQARIYVGQE